MLCVSMPLLCSRTRRGGGEEKSTAGLLCEVHSPLSWERHSPLARAVLPRGSLSAGPVRVRWRSSVGCRFLTFFYSAITLRVIASPKVRLYLAVCYETTIIHFNHPPNNSMLSTRAQSCLVLIAVLGGLSCLAASGATPFITETIWTRPSVLSNLSGGPLVKCIGSQTILTEQREFLFCEAEFTMAPASKRDQPVFINPENMPKACLAWLLTVVALVQTIHMSVRGRGSVSLRKVCAAFLLIASVLCFLLLVAGAASYGNLQKIELHAIKLIEKDAAKTATSVDLKQLVQAARESGEVPTFGVGVGLPLIVTASVLLCAGGIAMLNSATEGAKAALTLPTTVVGKVDSHGV